MSERFRKASLKAAACLRSDLVPSSEGWNWLNFISNITFFANQLTESPVDLESSMKLLRLIAVETCGDVGIAISDGFEPLLAQA